MRVSSVGFALDTVDDVLAEAAGSAAVTHNHPEGIQGAQATALAVFLARLGADKTSIKSAIEERFGYELARSLDTIRPIYDFAVSCQGSVPESLIAFLKSTDYAMRLRRSPVVRGVDTRHTRIFRREARLSRPIAALRLLPIEPAITRRRALLSGTIDAPR